MVKKEFDLDAKEKELCVSLAKNSIQNYFEKGKSLHLTAKEVKELPKKFLEKKACFVTLMIDGNLRGCIGHLNAAQELYKDILENACSAAFSDPRFSSLTEKEFSKIHIEVSVLTDPVDFRFKNSKELLDSLVVGEDGLIISKAFRSATFLPSVWEDLPKKEDFLSQLCMKAGLSADEWKRPGLKVQKYHAIKAK